MTIRPLAAAAALCLMPAAALADTGQGELTWAALYAGQAPAAARPALAANLGRAAAPEVRQPASAQPVARLVAEAAARHGVPVRFALAVAQVESRMRCQAVGRHGELGPLQIKPATARGLGYAGPASALNSCGAGLEWGMRHLAAAYRRCGTSAGAAALHNRGLASACVQTAYSTHVARTMARLEAAS